MALPNWCRSRRKSRSTQTRSSRPRRQHRTALGASGWGLGMEQTTEPLDPCGKCGFLAEQSTRRHEKDTRRSKLRGSPRLPAVAAALFVRTAAQRLYEKTPEGWRLRIDADTGLDLARIGQVVAVGGDRPAVWLTEVDEAGALQGIRLRVLQAGSPVPVGPWYRADLRAGVQTPSGDVVRTSDLDAGVNGPPSVAWWDETKGEHVLVAAGAHSGLLRFRAATSAPTSTADATVVAETLATTGERVVWLDVLDGRLVLVLEALDGSRRRIAWVPCGEIAAETLASSRTVQQSWIPDAALTVGVRIVACRISDAGRRVDALTERGRIMSYDRILGGWTSAQGTELLDPEGKSVGQVSSADVRGEQLLVVVPDGRVLRAAFRDGEASAQSLQMQLVHRPSANRPSASDVPVRVATEPDGALLFMGRDVAGTAVQPWTLRLDPTSPWGACGVESRSGRDWQAIERGQPDPFATGQEDRSSAGD